MTRVRRSCLYLLLAAALFVRALLPQGYMPERSADGGIAVTLCGSDGVWLIPLKDRSAPEGKGQRADQPCAFAALASAALPSSAGSGPVPPARDVVAYQSHSAPPGHFAATRFLPPATGPPHTA